MSFKNGSKVWEGAAGDTYEFIKRYRLGRKRKALGEIHRRKNRGKK